MKTAIATVCLSGGLDEKLLAIANAGFKGVEIFENDLLSFNGTPKDVRRAAEDLGLLGEFGCHQRAWHQAVVGHRLRLYVHHGRFTTLLR